MQPVVFPFNISIKSQVGAMVLFTCISPDGIDTQAGIWAVSIFTKYQLYKKDGKAKMPSLP